LHTNSFDSKFDKTVIITFPNANNIFLMKTAFRKSIRNLIESVGKNCPDVKNVNRKKILQHQIDTCAEIQEK